MEWFTQIFSKFAELPWWALVLVGVLVAIAIVTFILIRKSRHKSAPKADKKAWNTKMLLTGALCLSLSSVLSLVKIVQMPQGGALTLCSMLPIMMFAYIYGLPKGAVVAFAYSLLQLILDPFVVHWAQFLMDYTLAYTALCLAGLFKKNIVPGIIIAGAARYIMHVLSGVIFFADYAAGQNVWVYSTLYNSYVLIDVAIMVVLVLIVPQLRRFLREQRALAA